jgi:AraC-like DNA-binding protein
MQRAPEPKPRIELTPIQRVEGVEVARLFDWYGPRVSCFPGFTFSAPVRADFRAKLRYGAHERVATGGVVVTTPNHVLRVEPFAIPEDWNGGAMAFGVIAPPTMLTDEEHRRLPANTLTPFFEAPVWAQRLAQLCTALQNPELLACEKEMLVRSFLERALAETSVVRNEAANGCERAVKRARDYVHANFARAFSLEEVARETGLTKWHLARNFRKMIGLPIGEYARHVRAHRALRMLRMGTKASVLAAELGYCDQPHLTREMQAIFGFTPRHYATLALKTQAATRTDRAFQSTKTRE